MNNALMLLGGVGLVALIYLVNRETQAETENGGGGGGADVVTVTVSNYTQSIDAEDAFFEATVKALFSWNDDFVWTSFRLANSDNIGEDTTVGLYHNQPLDMAIYCLKAGETVNDPYAERLPAGTYNIQSKTWKTPWANTGYTVTRG